MPRGGKRQGTPGKAYANRTDMGQNYNPDSEKTPAAGGITPPREMAPVMSVYPEDTPMLLDPTARPEEPITAGLPVGPGPGPEMMDPRVAETRALKRFLPLIEPFLDSPETPESVVALVKYIRGA